MFQVNVVTDYECLSDRAAHLIISCIEQNPTATICLAGGNTPIGSYKILSKRLLEKQLDISGVTFVGLDEWVGLNGDIKGSCRETMDKYLYQPLGIAEENILFFDGSSGDLNKECKRVVYGIEQKGGLDFILLGIGLNGHVGFNEPGVSLDHKAHVVDLDPITQNVSNKYFSKSLKVTKGITLGMKLILSSEQVVVVANGEEKAKIVERAINGPASTEIPTSLLKNHKDNEFILDTEAAIYMKTNHR